MATRPYHNILLIQTGFVGDMVLTTPLIRALRVHAPESRITLVTAPRGAGIIEHNPHLNEVIVYDKKGADRGVGPFLKLSARLRAAKYDLVIAPHRSVRSGLLAWRTGAHRRIGFDHAQCRYFYTDIVPYSRWEGTFIRRKLRLLEPLDIFEENETPELHWSPETEKKIAARLDERKEKLPFAVLAVGSAWATKRWPAERFAEAATQLREHGFDAIAVGGPGDKDAGRIAHEKGGAHDWTGTTSLPEVAALLAKASLFIGNDSGTLHMARATRTPAVALFGPTGPEQFRFDNLVRVLTSDAPCAPCADHGHDECPKGNWICMPGISAERVVEAAEDLGAIKHKGERV